MDLVFAHVCGHDCCFYKRVNKKYNAIATDTSLMLTFSDF